MKKRWFVLSALMVLLTVFAAAWLDWSGRVTYLALDRRLSIEINGVTVEGEIYSNRVTAILTRRDTGKEHSYQLLFEGDIDSTGDMGSVIDCREWVAPHLPFILKTRGYPPCKRTQADDLPHGRWPLIHRGNSMQFVTKDGSTVSVVMPDKR
jgi:hypothetical protein